MDKYYLIGERLGHSFSAEIHRAFGRYDYELKELCPAELGPFLEARDFAGLNVTVPYKEAVIPYLDRLDEQAAAIGAVNTVINRDGALWGYNTDFWGMEAALRRLWGTQTAECRPCEGTTVLILGTGGTSKTALAACRALGARKVFRVSRTGREGTLSYEQAAALFGTPPHPSASQIPSHQGEGFGLAEPRGLVVINCTPAGMWPDLDGGPLGLAGLPGLEGVFDCVYNPLRTRLVLEAQARGVPAAGGLYMLVKQAARACALFTGAPAEETQVDIIFNALRLERENLVLIGMPGSGKSTVSRILARKTGKTFVDSDEEIVKRAGKSIPAIFAEVGEAEFRDLEADVIRDLAGRTGLVIAVGGGTVLREENVRRLKQNGRLVFLDRPLDQLLPSPDRPLGDTAEKVARLYAERSPVYLAAADEIVDASGEPETVAERIAP